MIRAWRKNLRLLPTIVNEYIHGVDFSVFEEHEGSDSKFHDSNPYERSSSVLINKFLALYPPSASDSFLDVGCGKGIVFTYVKNLPFRKLAGIESSKRLASIAERNMSRLNIPAAIINADAADFSGYDDFSYIYMFNPFGEKTMNAMADEIRGSLVRCPRTIVIAYSHPQYDSVWTSMASEKHWFEAKIDGLSHAMAVYKLNN